MELKDKLKSLQVYQETFLKEYQEAVKEFETSDMVNQNLELKKEIEKYKSTLNELNKKYQEALSENKDLRITLNEQILDEKLNILKISKEKLNVYFKNLNNEYNDRLTALEQHTKVKISKIRQIAETELSQDKKSFLQEIDKLAFHLQEKLSIQKEKLSEGMKKLHSEAEEEYSHLQSQEVSEEVIKKRIKQNNLEIKIGLSWINKIGIVLILIGIATGIKYTSSFLENEMSNLINGIAAYIVGILLLVGGEWLNRKEKNIFALGLTGGGIGTLYLSTFASFFILKIMDMNVAILISVLITTVALVLSIRYNSATICSLGLIGGFLPFFTYVYQYGLDNKGLYIAMGYLFILNLLTLLVSLYKKWDVANYISFLLNVPSLIYLVFEVPNEMIGIMYSFLTFSMYLTIILAHPFKLKLNLKILDIILLALNTLISCIIVFALFEKAELTQFRGALALVFCLVYFGLGQFLERFMKQEKSTKVIFYLTSYAFAILVMPFQLGIQWFAMGWLAEGVLMIIYGYKNKIKYLEIGGWVIFSLCFASVLLVDFVRYELVYDKESVPHFHFRYLAVMIGLVSTLFMYLIDMKNNKLLRYSFRGKYVTFIKYFTLINFWVFAVYNTLSFYNKVILPRELFAGYLNNKLFFGATLFSLATIVVAYVYTKIPLLYDRFVKYLSAILFIIANFVCIFLTLFVPIFAPYTESTRYLAISILIAFNVFSFFSIKDLVIQAIRKWNFSLEYYPLLAAIYLLYSISVILTVQFDLRNINLIISIIYIAAAFSFIIFGFKKKYIFIRRFGLGLSVLSTGKLFIYDLAFLNTVGRIIAFFVFGFVLLLISFVYQKLGKYMEISNKSVD